MLEDAGVSAGARRTSTRRYRKLERRALARRPLPMVVPFPIPRRALAAPAPDAFIAELLRQAIGYRVRIG